MISERDGQHSGETSYARLNRTPLSTRSAYTLGFSSGENVHPVWSSDTINRMFGLVVAGAALTPGRIPTARERNRPSATAKLAWRRNGIGTPSCGRPSLARGRGIV